MANVSRRRNTTTHHDEGHALNRIEHRAAWPAPDGPVMDGPAMGGC
jgi:hypothetical protein